MRFASSALAREGLIWGIVRFAAVGLFSTTLYFVIVNVLIFYHMVQPLVASTIAYCICIVSSFIMQSKIVFRYSGNNNCALLKFGVLSLSGLMGAQLIFWLSVQKLALSPLYASALVSLAIPLVNFLVMNFWVFVERSLESRD